ncbi:hypothetical protein CNR22_16520 [Sphingobacteriaceae bacterium]|nr:hypothetical protein CNR22_16520 [Sphingobacteriaceae bacterium]
MNNANYRIQIAEPCHEDWNAMLPEAKGKFCSSCSKSVIDFSNKTDLEIHAILLERKNEKVCGHFKTTQVNRPLNIRLDLHNLPENMSSTKRFAFVLLMIFGTMLFSFTDLKGQKIKNVQLEDTETVVYMKGKIARTPVKEETLPLPPDSLIMTEPMIMGGIRYVEPDTVITKEPETEMLMGDTMLISEEKLKDSSETVELQTLIFDPTFSTTGLVAVMEDPVTDTSESKESEQNKTFHDLTDHLLISSDPEVILYPNPATEEFSIRYDVLKRSDIEVSIYDDKGALVKNVVNIKQQYEGKYIIPVDLKDFRNGIYFITILNDEKKYLKKLVVAK